MSGSPRACVLALLATWLGQPLDDGARAWVQAHRAAGLETPMRVVSDQSRLVLLAGGAVAVVTGASGRAFVLESAVVLLPVNAVVEALKWCVNRTRPDGERNRPNSSFPSSHAANACAVAAVIARRWRRAAIPAWAAAALVSYSRVYLERHWLSDVAFGALLAIAAAWISAMLTKRRLERSAAAGAA